MSRASALKLLRQRHLEASIVFGQAFSLGTSILITRTGGPTVRGQVTTVAIWAQLLGWLACFSMDKAIVHGARGDPEALPDLTRYAIRRVSWNLVVASMIAVAVLDGLLPDGRLVIIAVAAIALTAFLEIFQGMLLATQDLRRYSVVRFAQPFGYFIAALAIWIAIHGGSRGPTWTSLLFSGALVASLGGSLAWALALTRSLIRRPRHRRVALARARRRSFLSFSASTQVATSLQYVNARLDLLVLPFVASARTVGIYAVASACAQFVALGGTASFLRHFSLGHQKRDILGLIAALVLATCLIAAAPWLLPAVFGSPFSASVGLARVLALGGVASFGMQAANGILLGNGRPRAVAWAQGIGAAVFAIGVAIDTTPMFVAAMSTASFAAAWAVAEYLIRSGARRAPDR